MADSYVCSGAIMKCTMGTSQAKLTVLPDRVTDLTGKPMANISDHKSFVNLGAFGRCRSLGYPATASATAAAHGHLTPMPCVHKTPFPWMGGKMDYIIKGQPALLKSCKCQCMWGGTISLVTDGQTYTGPADLNRIPREAFATMQNKRQDTHLRMTSESSDTDYASNQTSQEIGKEVTENTEITPYTEAYKHYNELKLKKIDAEQLKQYGLPNTWIDAFNKAYNRACDNYSEKDITESFSDIELAYNIYKLATNKEAKILGYDSISYKMPHQIFDIAYKVSDNWISLNTNKNSDSSQVSSMDDRVPDFLTKMPSKDFWDSFEKYIPLYTNIHEEDECNAYYDPRTNSVVISMLDEDNINRLSHSDWFKSGLLHHEFGHAQDSLRKWSSNQEFIDVFNEFQQEIIDDNVETKLNELIAKYQDENKYTDDVEEQLGGLSDCIQAALQAKVPPEKRWVGPRGHPGTKRDGVYTFDYFDKESLRMAEFIAHSSENYWSGNDLFKSLCPKTYEKTRKTIEQLLTSK